MPSSAALDKIIGAAPNDHLDVDQGEGTFLNTREWKRLGHLPLRVPSGDGRPAADADLPHN